MHYQIVCPLLLCLLSICCLLEILLTSKVVSQTLVVLNYSSLAHLKSHCKRLLIEWLAQCTAWQLNKAAPLQPLSLSLAHQFMGKCGIRSFILRLFWTIVNSRPKTHGRRTALLFACYAVYFFSFSLFTFLPLSFCFFPFVW